MHYNIKILISVLTILLGTWAYQISWGGITASKTSSPLAHCEYKFIPKSATDTEANFHRMKAIESKVSLTVIGKALGNDSANNFTDASKGKEEAKPILETTKKYHTEKECIEAELPKILNETEKDPLNVENCKKFEQFYPDGQLSMEVLNTAVSQWKWYDSATDDHKAIADNIDILLAFTYKHRQFFAICDSKGVLASAGVFKFKKNTLELQQLISNPDKSKVKGGGVFALKYLMKLALSKEKHQMQLNSLDGAHSWYLDHGFKGGSSRRNFLTLDHEAMKRELTEGVCWHRKKRVKP